MHAVRSSLLALALLSIAAVSPIAVARAQNVLLVRVRDGGTSGAAHDGLTAYAASILRRAGATVTEVTAAPGARALPPLSAFDQIWWLDFEVGGDIRPEHLAAIHAVGDWWSAPGLRHTIVDARIVSSLWTFGTTASVGVEESVIRNYYRNLLEVGGGLVVGTDHEPFAYGANALLDEIGFVETHSYYYVPPYRANVGTGISLFTYPETAWHTCTDSACLAGSRYIRDDSSTGYVPIGPQPNGVFLHPCAWHGNSSFIGDAAVSATFLPPPSGPPTARITTPADAPTYFAVGTGAIPLVATATGGRGALTYTWTASPGGTLASGASSSLPSGSTLPTTITLTVRDVDGRTVTDTIDIYPGVCGTSADCPPSLTCVDGVCCNTPCGGGDPYDCQACSRDLGGATDGTCTPIRSDVVIVCRPRAGVCDADERCAPTSTACPADERIERFSVCRAAAGDCDVPEQCDGTAAACPTDGFVATGTRCRASTGVCDVLEACAGGPTCPDDDFVAAGTTCRAGMSICDATETCTGDAGGCPDDAPRADGEACDDGVACNGAETCLAGACAPGPVVDCDDDDACTAESCTEPGGTCEHTPVDGCCNVAADCGDGESCTTDVCSGAGGTCSHDAIAACCHTSEDCDDGEGCTTDDCVSERCTHVDVCLDAGLPDASVTIDGAVGVDAAMPTDGGRPSADGGPTPIDGGRPTDGGGGDASTTPPVNDAGCACRAGRSDAPLGLCVALSLVALGFRRRR